MPRVQISDRTMAILDAISEVAIMGDERTLQADGSWLVSLEAATIARVNAMARPGESFDATLSWMLEAYLRVRRMQQPPN